MTRDEMPGLFWPKRFNEDQSRLARFGREAHFYNAGGAVAVSLVGLLSVGSAISQASEGRWSGVAYVLPWGLTWLAIALGIYLGGRGLRYVFAGE